MQISTSENSSATAEDARFYHPVARDRSFIEEPEDQGGERIDAMVQMDNPGRGPWADNPGLTLFHCHMQLHIDFGFMQLFEYA
jgi:hypothetical protein